MNNETHQHEFVIPVEWKILPSSSKFVQLNSVTKLRCKCGEEIKR